MDLKLPPGTPGIALACALVLQPGAPSIALGADPASVVAPHESASEAGLLAAEAARFNALVSGGVDRIAPGLAEELVYVHGSGAVQTREEYLASLHSGRFRYRGIDVVEQSGRLYGEVGVTHGLLRLHAGVDLEFVDRYTGVYRWSGGAWLLVSWQTTDVKPASDAPPAGR